MNKTIFLVVLLFTVISYSQTKKEALRDAKITAKATLSSDFKTVLKHTLPKIVTLMGGEKKALTLIKTSFESMKKRGFIFEKSTVIAVSEIVKEQGQYRCYIENNNQMKMPDMRIYSKSFLLGIYNEKDKYWWFLEAERLKDNTLINQIIPNYKTLLKIPKDEIKMEKINK